ncbi:MAG: hypothetical protein IV097_10810 [Burkholderiaceae bacterium]|nr:hypothetical protein [Burkholderiaceae bacterium]
MPHYLDLERWPRRNTFEHFRRLGNPFFSLCGRVEVGPMLARVRQLPGATPFLAYHHAALRAVHAVEAFRYRLEAGPEGLRVRLHEVVHAGAAVLREDQTLGFTQLRFDPDFGRFVELAKPVLEAAKRPDQTELGDTPDDLALVHMTTIPWLSFTSFSHARPMDGIDSVPKLAFGAFAREGDRTWMPVSVDVHHALMDGLQVGQFFAELQAALLPG